MLAARTSQVVVNDFHSQLNRTAVDHVVHARNASDLQDAVRQAALSGRQVSISGGRHAMGGQQFSTNSVLIDTTELNAIYDFDKERGTITVGGGVQWPQLIDYLCSAQNRSLPGWTIAQKQTGCDNLSIGGAISANVHGRGLSMKPFISDIESFDIVNPAGALITCSRSQNYDLFRLASGGYGLFGPIVSATLRLAPRTALKRHVEVVDCTELMDKFDQRITDGYLYGDFQFAINENSEDFLRKGLLSSYLPVDPKSNPQSAEVSLSTTQWKELLYLAHVDKQRAFDVYAGHYLNTNGQVYWSDRFQLATYLDGYHAELDERIGGDHPATEIISEIYVPRRHLSDFLLAAGDCLRDHKANLIYGTVRLIEQDDESFLAWARENFACAIFNLHTEHSPAGIERSARAFRGLIDLAIKYGGSYYLTYHKFAEREQLIECYPQFDEFVAQKVAYDPSETFSSNWYRYYR